MRQKQENLNPHLPGGTVGQDDIDADPEWLDGPILGFESVIRARGGATGIWMLSGQNRALVGGKVEGVPKAISF